MNVFACHQDPIVSATWLADQHVVKMVTETAQILSSALVLRGVEVSGLYKLTHVHHPCVQAAYRDPAYFDWALRHGLALATEYQNRYGKKHASEQVLRKVSEFQILTSGAPYVWPLAMPAQFHQPDPHEAYRVFLISKYEEWRFRGGRVSPRWKRIVPNNPFTI